MPLTQNEYLVQLLDPQFFIESCLFIVDKDSNKVPFIWRPLFKKWWDNHTNNDFIVKARKMGFSAGIDAIWLHACIFQKNTRAVIVSEEESATRRLLERVRYYIDTCLVPINTRKNSEHEISFPDTNSTLWIGTAGQRAFGRGDDITHLHLSEYLWYQNMSVVTGVKEAMRNNGVVVRESTANGAGTLGHQIWLKAIAKENEIFPHFFGWFEDEDYCSKDHTPFELTAEETDLKRTLNLSWGQLRWRREKIANMDEPEKFPQEYPCVTGDTMVSTDDGIIPIQEVKPKGAITAFFPKGTKHVFEVTTSLGYRVQATADHLIAITGGFKKVCDLIKGDIILLKKPEFSKKENVVTYNDCPSIQTLIPINLEMARLLGYFMGDGSFSGGCCGQGVYYGHDGSAVDFACCNDEDVINDICGLISNTIGANYSIRETGKKTGNSFSIRSNSKLWGILLDRLGCLRKPPNDGRKRKVCVPDCIWKSPKPIVREFLKGVFESDGFNGYKYPRVMFFSKYKKFASDIQLLLLGFGITSKLTSVSKKAGDGHIYTGNELSLRTKEAVLFNQEIGFISSRKRNRTPLWKENKRGRYADDISLSDKVESIIPIGEREVFDITTEPDHIFDANGICVHNCSWKEAFLTSGQMIFKWQDLKRQEDGMLPVKWHGDLVNLGGQIVVQPNKQGNFTVWRTPRVITQ